MNCLDHLLFNSVGTKTKKPAKIFIYAGAAISIIAGIVTIIWEIISLFNYSWYSQTGILITLCGIIGATSGIVFASISSMVLHGFGKIVKMRTMPAMSTLPLPFTRMLMFSVSSMKTD